MRQWAIIVGLNEYQFLQPLNCAQQDAQALYQFLIHEAGFRPEQCLLFTNTSPQSWGRPTLPTRDNLQNWIELLVQECLQPEDSVWFFFSGCGVCYKGQDYLIPVDGHPSAIATTCIPITSLLERLNTQLFKGSLWVTLDISRSQGMLAHENVGAQTAQSTHQLKIPTLLSCQPGQFSREVSSLGHGLFTLALLEGLRYQPGTSIAALAQFLNDRLPELGEHYWQPVQKPLLICPPTQLNQPVLPAQVVAQAAAVSSGSNGHSPASHLAGSIAESFNRSPYPSSSPATHYPSTSQPIANYPPAPTFATATAVNPAWNSTLEQANSVASPTPNQSSTPPPTPSTAAPTSVSQNSPSTESEEAGIGLWKPILLWGGLIALGLGAGVLWRNQTHLLSPQAPVPKASQVGEGTNSTTMQPVSVSAGASGVTDNPNQPLDFAPSPAQSPSPGASDPLLASSSVSSSAPSSPVPLDQKNPEQKNPEQKGLEILAHARKMIESDQATPYRDAIDELRKISPQDPIYPEAQAAIDEWSQKILTIAQKRVELKQVDIAVMAADLVPPEDAKRSPQAKAAIAQLCPAVQALPGDTFPQQKAQEICSRAPI